jgi:hypothetical protein
MLAFLQGFPEAESRQPEADFQPCIELSLSTKEQQRLKSAEG